MLGAAKAANDAPARPAMNRTARVVIKGSPAIWCHIARGRRIPPRDRAGLLNTTGAGADFFSRPIKEVASPFVFI
jgi:hypothetical protein